MGNKFEGTKGEWNISKSGNPTFETCVISEDKGSVCFITNWSENYENAKLISAAPELLEAALEVIKVWEEDGDCGEIQMKTPIAWQRVLRKATFAIEKALK